MGKPKKKIGKITKRSEQSSPKTQFVSSLDILRAKRTGGSQNIRGIEFQILYSCYCILQKLTDEHLEMRLEGLEDLDCIGMTEGNEYIQLKTSKNTIGAHDIWELKVLQNFLDTYMIDSTAKFKLVHNSVFAKGHLQNLQENPSDSKTLDFWKRKFNNSNVDTSTIDLRSFFSAITYEGINDKELKNKCLNLLIKNYNLNDGTENQYFNALFNNAFIWAKERKVINKKDIDQLILNVTESFSKSATNPAIEKGWIKEVFFETGDTENTTDYFDGKAAKPIHIANNLPAKRPYWEGEIKKGIKEFDITLIRSSSGQGKSTLGWQASMEMMKQGYHVFQLNYCNSYDDASHLVDFIKTRMKIGQAPLIVVDGLNPLVSGWGLLAEQLKDLPVKFLISTREEDWVRFSYDLSRLKLKPIEIKLTREEAKEVYTQLRNKNKIHSKGIDWQVAWEKVEEKGLLIEFVYLLTQGQMIVERINQQVNQLYRDKDSNSKTEILRLVSLADTMNLKLKTSKLIDYINSTVRFESDRNFVLSQLEKEYYVKFDSEYVEGLHPIRSQHILDALHTSISYSNTILGLFSVLEENYLYDFFTIAPFLLPPNERKMAYEKITDMLSTRKFSEIVYSIDGLMRSEASKYWETNKRVFDEVARTQAIDIFVYDTLPYTKLNMIGGIKGIKSDSGSLEFLGAKLKELTQFTTTDSDLRLFVSLLHDKLINRKNDRTFEGLGFLTKWFRRLDLNFPKLIEIEDNFLLNVLREKSIDEASEVFSYFSITDQSGFEKFTAEHKTEIIAWLKRRTNSLTIEEKGDDIHINYLLDSNHEKTNEHSIYRINTVYQFLPNYKHYCTEAIIFPFPNREIYKVVIQNSIKKLTKDVINDTFDTHINQIWADAILSNYRLSSVYEWQNKHFDLRVKSLDFVKKCVRVFEAHLELNNNKIASSAKEWGVVADELLKLHIVPKKYPKSNNRYYEEKEFKEERRKINDWAASLSNFLNQMVNIIAPKGTNDRNLAVFNLREAVHGLTEMQVSYQQIANSTFDYFPSKELSETEKNWYWRLLKTVLFYVHKATTMSLSQVIVAKSEVENWYEKNQNEKIQRVQKVILDYQDTTSFKFYLPSKIIEEGNLATVIIGVEGISIDDPELNDLLHLSVGLIDLDKIDVHFFTFVLIKNGIAIGGFRAAKNYFERMRAALETGSMEESSFGNPTPIIPSQEYLTDFEGVELPPQTFSVMERPFFEGMFNVAQLKEYRKRLNKKSSIECEWLEEIESEYATRISKQLFNNKANSMGNELVMNYLSGKVDLSEEEIIHLMSEKLKQINKMY